MVTRTVQATALIAATLATLWVLRLTRAPGPGLSPDTQSYLGAARELALGREPRVPFTGWGSDDSTSRLRAFPPGVSMAVAAASRAGLSLEQGGRAVLALAAGVGMFALMLAVGAASGPLVAGAAAVAILLSPVFVETHKIVLSEAPYLACLAVLLLLMAMDDPPVVIIGLVAAAGVMVRYAGLSLAGAAALSCLLERRSVAARVSRAALAAGPALAAFLLWSRWAGGARSYGFKPGFFQTLAQGSDTAQEWLLPIVPSGIVRAALAIVVAVTIGLWCARAAREPGAPRLRQLLRACALLGATFAGLMIASRVYADGAIIFDNRLLSPLFLLGTVAIVAAGANRWSSWSAAGRTAAGFAFIAWLAGSANLAAVQVRELDDDGWGFASRDWQSSALAVWLRDGGRGYRIFSDNPPATWSLAHRPSRHVPDTADSATVADLREILLDAPAAIISYAENQEPDHPRGEVFARKLGWHRVLASDEGDVWLAGADSTSARQPDHGAQHRQHDHDRDEE